MHRWDLGIWQSGWYKNLPGLSYSPTAMELHFPLVMDRGNVVLSVTELYDAIDGQAMSRAPVTRAPVTLTPHVAQTDKGQGKCKLGCHQATDSRLQSPTEIQAVSQNVVTASLQKNHQFRSIDYSPGDEDRDL